MGWDGDLDLGMGMFVGGLFWYTMGRERRRATLTVVVPTTVLMDMILISSLVIGDNDLMGGVCPGLLFLESYLALCIGGLCLLLGRACCLVG